MNKQKAIEILKNADTLTIQDTRTSNLVDMVIKSGVIAIVEQIDEPQKPLVQQFVADWYEENKNNLDKNIYDCIVGWGIHSKEIRDWMRETSPFQTLVNMHQFGYTVEKEKRYTVKMKNLRALFCYLAYIPDEGYWSLMASGGESIIIKHTHKELEEAGFGDVFNSPLFEVEEVEE